MTGLEQGRTRPYRFLILTADVGFGHRKAAVAIAAALQERYGRRSVVEVVNPLDDRRTLALLRDSQADYDRLVREIPEVYRVPYQVSDAPMPIAILESALTVIQFRVIQDIVRRSQPDVILTTHPLYLAPLRAVLDLSKRHIPFFTVITDLAQVHRLWLNDAADLILLPNETAQGFALSNKLPAEKLVVTGIPVHPDLAREKRPKQDLRRVLGWHLEMTTTLVVSSKRVKNLDPVLNVLNHSGFPLQLAVVAGGDAKQYIHFKKTAWHTPVHVYNFVENMPTLMHASDFIICKAGGLVVTEALAVGLPLLLVDVTPGQEEGNARYVIDQGAAHLARSGVDALETVCHWMQDDRAGLLEHARMARSLGKPESALRVAELAWEAAVRGPQPLSARRRSMIPRLRELLGQSGIPIESLEGEEAG